MSETKRLKIMNGLDIRCSSNSWLGRIIDYMQKMPSNSSSRDLAIEMLFARFLPLVLDRNSPSNRVIAIECAIKCETWAKVIRELWGLNEPTPTYPTVYSLPQIDRGFPLPTAEYGRPQALDLKSRERATNTPSNLSSPEAEIIERKELTSKELTAKAKELEEFEQMLVKTVDSSSSVWSAKDKLVEMQPQDESDWTEAQWKMWDEYTTKQENIIDQQLLGDLADRLKGGSNQSSEGGEVKG